MSKTEKLLRRFRQKAFDYPSEKDEQLSRVLDYLKRRIFREQKKAPGIVGPYSGLTRAELQKTGTCETDWY